MKLNRREQLILAGVFCDREHWAKQEWNGSGLRSTSQLGAYRVRITDAREGLIAMNPADWLGHSPTPSDSVLMCRAYARLETLGLLERCNRGGYSHRTSHLKLPDTGEEMARQLREIDLIVTVER